MTSLTDAEETVKALRLAVQRLETQRNELRADNKRIITERNEYMKANMALTLRVGELVAENERLSGELHLERGWVASMRENNENAWARVGELEAENERLQRENSDQNVLIRNQTDVIAEYMITDKRLEITTKDYAIFRPQLLETREDRDTMADMLRQRQVGNAWEVKYIHFDPERIWQKSDLVQGYLNQGFEVLGTTGYIMWFRRAVNKAASDE